jgi:hypothetical protein
MQIIIIIIIIIIIKLFWGITCYWSTEILRFLRAMKSDIMVFSLKMEAAWMSETLVS